MDEVELETSPGHVAHGAGRIDLLGAGGPLLSFRGTLAGSFDAVQAALGMDDRALGEVYPLPDCRASARCGSIPLAARFVSPYRNVRITPTVQPTAITGEYLLRRCRIGAGAWSEGCVTEVHVQGPRLHLNRFAAGVRATHAAPVIRWREHAFALHGPQGAVGAELGREGGAVAVVGPVEPGSAAWWDLLHPFTHVLGSALGSPVAAVGWDVWSPDRAEWRFGEWCAHDTGRGGSPRPVGGDALDRWEEEVARWTEAGLRAWDAGGTTLGLEVVLSYVVQASSRRPLEAGCRDLVVAIERLLLGVLRARGQAPAGRLSDNLARARRLLAHPLLEGGGPDREAEVLQRFRNRLAHEGTLSDDDDALGLQRLADADGWLRTCAYRLLSAVFGVDVPIADLAARGYPRRRPSEGGFAPPPFVPSERRR